ncbi:MULTISPECIES: replication protein [unclassified Paenibacillus]|uniref:replication protein n=1 Tax=unclassified Paenibacillus TaxID=185978 RepID=UPI002405E946|nr:MULTISPECIES: replication protein [unclassified Paenibacillus]MDF9845116.1 phage replication O-like protein O [Paenibacillus sp. PastF-2]MDF9851715.1 phage replication O-like protein O [Paenibacillus sp. PastM-2]MDF9858332.1 phage replication O-like protein O [Paenibacillus sp. PastF-1]MDH6483588.1 phage replication O-like protein O [Paenibacillus sp. PastH-2]MDH6511007.1 phage replication O-like protein O [Paenibacillus sp. PastM-3]
MASPQTENGFTSIAHEILEQVARQRFNGIQRSIIDIIWRYTYGFKRKSHQLATGFIAEAIDADLKGVKVELAKLIAWKVVLVVKEGHGARPRTLSFNKNYEQWLVGENSPPKITKRHGGESSTAVVESSTPLVVENSTPKIERKKNIKKEEIDMKIPPGKQAYADTVFLTTEQYEKLCTNFGKKRVDDTIEALDEWQTNKKPSQHKKDHNKTLRVWIKKDLERNPVSKAQKKQQEMTILNQFYEEGAAREANGNGELLEHDQNRLSLL